MMDAIQVERAFLDRLAEHGLRLSRPELIRMDGKIHRLQVDGDRGNAKNLAYLIHFDDRPSAWFKYHKTGDEAKFSLAGDLPELSQAERAQLREQARIARERREQEQAARYAERAKWCLSVWNAAAAVANAAAHPYLTAKGIESPRTVRLAAAVRREEAFPGTEPGVIRGALLVPVYADGGLSSLQIIDGEGGKLFVAEGRQRGAYHPIKGPDASRVLVAEGYATGAALNAHTQHPVACAMSAGNLLAVAEAMQAKFPDAEIILAADNDWQTAIKINRNPGLEAARVVADKLGLRVIAPEFTADQDGSDWDDWLRLGGDPGQIRAQLEGREFLPPEPAVDPPADPPADLLPRAITADLVNAADPDADGLPEMYSEDNVALRFSQLFADDLRYVAPWGRWMRWRDQRWCHEDTLEVFDLSRKVCRSVAAYVRTDQSLSPKQQATVAGRYGLSATVASVERFAKADRRHAASTTQWDADIWSLNTPAGVVNLRTGAVTPGDRTAYMTKITRVAPGGACPTWLRFLATATNHDAELIAFLQRMAGYCLTGSTRDHALFFVYGTGGNGKGTFLNTLQWIIGDYAKAAAMDVFTEKKHESHPTELAGLMGARMVTAQETEEGKRWAEARIKALTGGDPITARFMRQDNFEFIPQFKLVIAGNHKPGLRNVDEAIKRRLHLIPFTVTIAPQDRDARLGEKLQAEAGGILQWAIDGCLDWLHNGLQAPAAVIAATDEYLEQEDQFANWIAESCEVGTIHSHTAKPLYASYKQWAERSGEYAIPQKRWAQQMATRGFESHRANTGVMYRGIRVKPDNSF